MTIEIVLKSYLGMEQKYRHEEMKKLLQCQVQYQLKSSSGNKISRSYRASSLHNTNERSDEKSRQSEAVNDYQCELIHADSRSL
jgi:hypothetical protein